MYTPWIVLGVIAVVVLVLAVWVVGMYNGLVTLRNRFKRVFAD